MTTVTVYYSPHQRRSMILAEAAFKGCKRSGYKVKILSSLHYKKVDSDYAVFYGLACGLDRVMRDYSKHKSAKALYIDLGFYHRRIGKQRYNGYHKISVDGRHPMYLMDKDMPDDRWKQLVALGGLEIKPWRTNGEDVLIAGMSAKASAAENLGPLEWERDAVAKLIKHTDRKIRLRPKPNCTQSRPIPGTIWHNVRSLDQGLHNVHAVVARHSNVCVDALLEGIPIFCDEGISKSMGLSDLSRIEKPYYPDNRERFLCNMAYQQWRTSEIEDGSPFKYLEWMGVI